MSTRWLKRTVLISLSICVFVTILFIIYAEHEEMHIHNISEQLFKQREDKFYKSPNVIDAMALMRKNWEHKRYNKTIFYAEYCIKYGIDNTDQGWIVHAFMANAYIKLGNNEEACINADMAVKLSQRYNVSDENIKRYRLQDIIKSCNVKAK